MIRVEQTFSCTHDRVPDRAAPMPVVVKSQGHSVALENRVCYCLGQDKPTDMRRTVRTWDPDPVLS